MEQMCTNDIYQLKYEYIPVRSYSSSSRVIMMTTRFIEKPSIRFQLSYTNGDMIETWVDEINPSSPFSKPTHAKYIYTIENDIVIDYFIRNGEIFISFDVRKPTSFDRTMIITQELAYEINNFIQTYSVENKSIQRLINDKQLMNSYIKSINCSELLAIPPVSEYSMHNLCIDLNMCIKRANIRLYDIREERNEHIRKMRKELHQRDCICPEYGDESTYNKDVDFTNPYSESFEAWAREGFPGLHCHKF